MFVGPNGEPVARDGVQVRWSADERVADGFYAARSMQLVREIMENPGAEVVTASAGEAIA